MSPAQALTHIQTLIDGTESFGNERLQRLLLQSIAELARKGLEQPEIKPATLLSFYRPANFRWQ